MEIGKIRQHIQSFLASLPKEGNFELLELQQQGDVLCVVLDHLMGVSIEDCAERNRFLRDLCDQNEEDWEIEVSSYSLTNPFVFPFHYHKNKGRKVKILTQNNQEIQAILKNIEGEYIYLELLPQKIKKGTKKELILETKMLHVPSEVRKTHLLFTF